MGGESEGQSPIRQERKEAKRLSTCFPPLLTDNCEMADRKQKRGELERDWKDAAFVDDWQRRRKKRFADLQQGSLRDSEGTWDQNLVVDDGIDWGADGPWVHAHEPQIKPSRPGQKFVFPEPIKKGDGVEYPLAKRCAVPAEQQDQASRMFGLELRAKAKRLAHCGAVGQRCWCVGSDRHLFYRPFRCGVRYCKGCGSGNFTALFVKYLRLEKVAKRLVPHWPVEHRPSRAIAKIDFTIRNTGKMPTPGEIKKFNRDIRKFFRAVELRFGISRSEYGVAWCNEFGGSNTNLHAHGVYAGPWLPQKKKKRELSRLFTEVVGDSGFVSIKMARSFPAALAHALKYPAQFISRSNPERLAQLEAAFHGVNRIHSMASFYNPKSGSGSPLEPDIQELMSCPVCEAEIRVIGWSMQTVMELKKEGLRSYSELRQEKARREVSSAPGRAPP